MTFPPDQNKRPTSSPCRCSTHQVHSESFSTDSQLRVSNRAIQVDCPSFSARLPVNRLSSAHRSKRTQLKSDKSRAIQSEKHRENSRMCPACQEEPGQAKSGALQRNSARTDQSYQRNGKNLKKSLPTIAIVGPTLQQLLEPADESLITPVTPMHC